jgi:YVTN family beta-propeller protein
VRGAVAAAVPNRSLASRRDAPAASYGRAYVSNAVSNDVSVIDTTTNTAIATVPGMSLPGLLTFNPTATIVYVVNQNADSIALISTASNALVGTIPTSAGSRPVRAAYRP